MEYRYVKEQTDYSDYASGRVFYSLPGHPAFPVRLASEIFQRCMASREVIYNDSTPCSLYDPCCGAAYQLGVLAYLHGERIREVIASDVDEKAVAAAQRNLGLLSFAGLNKRVAEIGSMIEQYNKDSHKEALASGHTLKNRLSVLTGERPFVTRVFQANAADGMALARNIQPGKVDIVFTDVPYGQHSQWQAVSENPLWSVLEALRGILSSTAVVAIISDKQQKAAHESYQRVEQFQIGKRRVVIFKAAQ